ncbi:MAG TPA: chitobiase/beta-hexosaminidase C-terminal domain-containing protein [Puia sp.]|jgi:uncharacterized membrane protein/Leucine-rich repeat (LRR) protein|nr:chitobiase/beta-hexosaminidase C-terminal domain-containing protein [Puia sp.]
MVTGKNILFSVTIAANCLLCFLLIFYDRLLVPSLLQVAGRAHPLFLHFPIVLFALFIGWIWLVPKQQFHSPQLFQNICKWLLLATACTSAITALMGIFLSKEPGYNQDYLQLHKWSGALISLLTFLWYIFYEQLNKTKTSLAASSLVTAIILIIAGHQGASITHGDNFLLAPVYKGKMQNKVQLDEAVLFTDMVKPILDTKCVSCHNNKKAKGELVMETPRLLLKGGKNGALWDTTAPNLSLILQRIHLPEEEKKHMPPIGKPQLSDQEMAILYNWIKRGANFMIKVTELEPTDTLRSIARNMFRSSDEEENYDFTAANEKTIQKLNTNYRAVYPLSRESPAIAVDFFGAAFFKSEQLKSLLEIKTQLVSLYLNKIPVTDNDLQIIGQMTNLRNLNLSFSKITGNGLSSLDKLNHLKNLSLTNTSIKKEDIQKLALLKNLRRLYIWNSGLSVADADMLRKKYPSLDIQTGIRIDTMLIKLNPPIVQNEEQIIDTPVKLRLKHYVPGITIRYTVDGTEPDNVLSPVYDTQILIKKQVLMKAKAFKQGWHESDIVQYRFYQATYRPDTVILLTPADSLFKGKGGKTLKDLEMGTLNFGDGKWLAYRKNNMACMLAFSKPVRPQIITISSLVNIGALIFPPKSIRVWGGNDPNKLKPLYHIAPAQDTTLGAGYLIPYECKFNPLTVKFIKIVIEPVGKIPKQFVSPKNDTGWFFIDEIFVN